MSSLRSRSPRTSVSPTMELPLCCRPGSNGSASSAKSTPSSVARMRRSRKSSRITISPPLTPPSVATSSASARPRRVPCQRASSGPACSQARRRSSGSAGSKAIPTQAASQSRLSIGVLVGSVSRWALATRSSSWVRTPSKLASWRARKSAGVAWGRYTPIACPCSSKRQLRALGPSRSSQLRPARSTSTVAPTPTSMPPSDNRSTRAACGAPPRSSAVA